MKVELFRWWLAQVNIGRQDYQFRLPVTKDQAAESIAMAVNLYKEGRLTQEACGQIISENEKAVVTDEQYEMFLNMLKDSGNSAGFDIRCIECSDNTLMT